MLKFKQLISKDFYSFCLGHHNLQVHIDGCNNHPALLKCTSKLCCMDWLCKRTASYVVVLDIAGLMEQVTLSPAATAAHLGATQPCP